MKSKTQTALEISVLILVEVFIVSLLYGMWYIGKRFSYLFMYEGMVKQTVCEMVREDQLKNPADCK